jgi:hypothetical protein
MPTRPEPLPTLTLARVRALCVGWTWPVSNRSTTSGLGCSASPRPVSAPAADRLAANAQRHLRWTASPGCLTGTLARRRRHRAARHPATTSASRTSAGRPRGPSCPVTPSHRTPALDEKGKQLRRVGARSRAMVALSADDRRASAPIRADPACRGEPSEAAACAVLERCRRSKVENVPSRV